MASIHRDKRSPKGVYYCAFTLADGRRAFRSTGKRNRKEALVVCQVLQQTEEELARGELSRERLTDLFNETLHRLGEEPLRRITIAEWLNEWLASKVNIARNSRLEYEQAVREFLAWLGPEGVRRRIESVTEKDIRAFSAWLGKSGRRPGTVTKLVRRYLSGAFVRALRRGLIRVNPIAATEPEKFEVARQDTFRPEQVVRLVEAAGRSTDMAGAVLFAYTTGARLLDVANLRWSSLDLEHGVVSFRQRKTGQETIIGLHPDFVEWITEAKRTSDDPDAYVFPSLAGRPAGEQPGGALGPVWRTHEKGRHRRPSDSPRQRGQGPHLRGLSFHSFRGSAASAVFNQAALREITRRVTGHKGAVVDRYITKDLEATKEATKLIPRLPKLPDAN